MTELTRDKATLLLFLLREEDCHVAVEVVRRLVGELAKYEGQERAQKLVAGCIRDACPARYPPPSSGAEQSPASA